MTTGSQIKVAKGSTKSATSASAEQNLCPIVGIGASAGGLEATQELLKSLPPNTGMAFVLIQHLDPKHQSQISDILARHTEMPVQEVLGDTKIEPAHLYVIPATSSMIVADEKLVLMPREETHGRPTVIDRFFSSLAKERKNKAIGVILSGTGSDGVRGLSDIKTEGGITIAQDKSAKQEGMPKAAIASGCVDFVLSPDGIARELVRLGRHSIIPFDETTSEKEEANEKIKSILKVLRKATGVNFTFYKKGTIYRRISRRMVLSKLETLDDYLKFVEASPAELAALHQDLLIKVTSFFRDPEVFENLKRDVLPLITKDRSSEQPIRVWVPGCSTGEEVYSMAMLLTEHLEENQIRCSFQIFGTDLSETCIEKARAGAYEESLLKEVTEERRRRFFVKTNDNFEINKLIRERCVFAKHNLTQDPPFSGLDLISCRNLLIYLESSLQKRVLTLFHFALKQNGFLVLGGSENIGGLEDLFSTVDPKQKIFSRKLAPTQPHFDFVRPHLGKPEMETATSPELVPTHFDLVRETEHVIATRFGAQGVVINGDMEILQVRGRVGAFLEPATGERSYNLLKMARMGLLSDLRAAIQKSKKDKVPVRKENIRVKSNGDSINAYFEVLPVTSKSQEGYFVILFGECNAPTLLRSKGGKGSKQKPVASPPRVEELERELATMQEYLQSLIEKEQATNEELKSANEETLSSNEELQSTNEELETAKEELQSINEELGTLNDELLNRNDQLSVAVNDLNNLLVSVRIPVLMLSRDLRIRRMTPGAEKVMNVIPSDVGRPMTDMKLNFPDLVPLLRDVIDNVTPQERQVQDAEGRWISLWVRPYQTSDNKIDGAVITLSDIDAVKRSSQYADAIVQTVREPLLILDSNLRVKSANQSFYEAFQVSPVDTEGKTVYALGNGQWDIPQLRSLLEKVLPQNSSFNNFEVRHNFPKLGPRVMLLNARKFKPGSNDSELILLAIGDVTARQEAEDALKKTSDHLLRTNTELEQFAFVASHDLQEPLRTVSTYLELLSKTYSGKLGKDADKYIEVAINGARRMKALVEDLLTFSRTGREELKYEPIDCFALLDRILKDIGPVIQENKAEVTSGPLPTVLGNSRLLAQVFQNLITNAIKFHGVEPPKVHISATEKAGEWEFSVKDNGIGIEKKYSEKIFLIFQRLHGSERPGTGIGLATCKKIVERYGGRMWVESELGKGANFLFTIPPPASPDKKGGLMSKLTILSVDDNPADQELITLALHAAHAGVDLQTVGNGDEAIAYLWKQGKYANAPRPDLIILDLNLPKVSGLDVMREVRSDPNLNDIPIVIFTGAKASRETAALCALNPSFYVVKPDGIDALFAAVCAIAEYARSMVEAPKDGIDHGAKLRRLAAI